MTTASHDPQTLPHAALAGVLATIAMDIGARTIIAPALGIEALGPENLGRWIGHMRTGRIKHDDIASARPIPHEATIGIAAHYTIGAALGAGYELLLRATGRRRGSPLLALAYGTGTTVFSWFVMFPATGQGAMGRRSNPQLTALSVLNHVVYGLALGATVARLAVSPSVRARRTRHDRAPVDQRR